MLARPARLALGCVALAGLAWASAAHAQMITIPFGAATFKSSVEIRGYPSDGSCLQVYTPPAGQKLRITDVSIDSYGSTVAVPYQYICTGTPSCSNPRSAYLTAPAGNTLIQNFSLGILVTTGETLSVCNYGGAGKTTSWTFHGFLYTTP